VQTELDAEIVSWIGRVGAAGAEHIMARFNMGRRWAYHRLSRLVADGLLSHQTLLYRRPGLYVATIEGLRWRHLQRLGVFPLSPGGFEHAERLAQVAARLEPALPGHRALTDRELRIIENDQGEPLVSARLGELPGGRPALHRPDLALLGPEGRTVAVEIELSVKAPRRLQAICRAYPRARHLDHTYYLAAPAPARALTRAVRETRTHDRITILPLDDIDTLIHSELEGRP